VASRLAPRVLEDEPSREVHPQALKGCAPALDADYALEDVILEALAGVDVPIALGLSSGHTRHPFVTLPFGVRARLACGGDARFEVLERAVS